MFGLRIGTWERFLVREGMHDVHMVDHLQISWLDLTMLLLLFSDRISNGQKI